MASNPEISKYLLEGANIVQTGRGPHRAGIGEFVGKQFPTFFRPRRQEWSVGVGRTVTLEFETDAENNYFDRTVSPGGWSISDDNGDDWTNHWDRTGPNNGVARFRWDTGALPPGVIEPGRSFEFTVSVADESRIDRLENSVKVNIIEPIETSGGGGGSPRNQGAETVASPNIYEVYEGEWATHSLAPFDSKTAVRIAADSSNASERIAWDFYVNVDNEYIHHYSRRKNQSLEASRKSFSIAAVFLGLAIIRGEMKENASSADGAVASGTASDGVPETVDQITQHLAPVLLPMIESLSVGDQEGPSA